MATKKAGEHPISRGVLANWAFVEGVLWQTVGIVNTKLRAVAKGVFTQDPGACCALEFRGRRILLTAAHVVEAARPEDLGFFPRATGEMYPTTRIELHAGDPVFQAMRLPIANIFRCEWEDLAVITMEDGVTLDDYKIRTYTLPAVVPKVRARSRVCLVGFPTALGLHLGDTARGDQLERNIALAPAFTQGEIAKPPADSRFLRGFCRKRHLLVGLDK